MDAALQGAESAVAQVVVALAQVRTPVAMLKTISATHEKAVTLLQEVERLADVTMDVYQDAILTTADDAIMASAATTQAAAVLTQMRVNLTVTAAQLSVMQEAQTSGGGSGKIALTQALEAQKNALMHVEAAQQQVETAMRMAREIDLLQETDERQKTFQVVADANRVVEVHAIVVSAYVLTILAYAINHDQAVTAATEATQAAVALLQSIQPPARAPQTTVDIRVATVRVRLARAVTRIAMANSEITGVAAPDVAQEAAEIVKKRVERVLRAARQTAQVDASQVDASQAHVVAAIARADAIAAMAASRIVDAYVRLVIAQIIEKNTNTATAARIAAADQLQTAVALAREAESEANAAAKVANRNSLDALHAAVLRWNPSPTSVPHGRNQRRLGPMRRGLGAKG
ncbi:hypothetical protein C2W62_22630 [Candidatus Entotheonella serta]|nr:hypothetical protein C2W62_22630 [Candidatus Entotheonella serta]